MSCAGKLLRKEIFPALFSRKETCHSLSDGARYTGRGPVTGAPVSIVVSAG